MQLVVQVFSLSSAIQSLQWNASDNEARYSERCHLCPMGFYDRLYIDSAAVPHRTTRRWLYGRYSLYYIILCSNLKLCRKSDTSMLMTLSRTMQPSVHQPWQQKMGLRTPTARLDLLHVGIVSPIAGFRRSGVPIGNSLPFPALHCPSPLAGVRGHPGQFSNSILLRRLLGLFRAENVVFDRGFHCDKLL
jgi:hypothetical protein